MLWPQNPFPYLIRDSDVEGMSDGFDNGTAYGLPAIPMIRYAGCNLRSPRTLWNRQTVITMHVLIFMDGEAVH